MIDNEFLKSRIAVVTSFQATKVFMPKERLYYKAYARKIETEVMFFTATRLQSNSQINEVLKDIDGWEKKECFRVKNGLFVKPKSIIKQVCHDVKDVVNSMRRFEN